MKQVTIEEARKILGDEAEKLSDDQLQTLIDDLSVMAKWALDEAVRIRTQGDSLDSSRSKNDLTGV